MRRPQNYPRRRTSRGRLLPPERPRLAREEDEPTNDHEEPVDEQGQVFEVLKRGDKVTTEDGPGEVVDITLMGADYSDERSELEPPQITVKLDEDGQEIVVCPCAIDLEDEEATEFLHQEYERLWPPVEDLPGDAQTLVDDEKTRAFLETRFLRARRKATHVIEAQGPLTPGQIVEDIEGVEVGSGATVLDTILSDDQQQVELYLHDSGTTVKVTIPLDTPHRTLDIPPAQKPEDTVYDEELVDDAIAPVRTMPDSYLPDNPNYPSSLSKWLWNPTYRQYPPYVMYAKAKRQRKRRLAEPLYDNTVYETDEDWLANATELKNGDFLPAWNPTGENPLPLFDSTAGQPDKTELFDLAFLLWEEYQHFRRTKVPGVIWDHGNASFQDFALLFCLRHKMDVEIMDNVWYYLYDIGFIGERELRQWSDLLSQNQMDYRLRLFR
jgi:hypothetical protein